MDEEHKERTAFTVGPLGFFEFTRILFGLTNAPATFQRLMERCMGDLHLAICLVYLDDLIIFSMTYEEHLERLGKVFQRLRKCGLKLSPKKCQFFMNRVAYVGHIVTPDGIEADPRKTEKVRDWPTRAGPDELRQFLGFAGYYRKFVKDFSKIARPLTDLLPPTRTKNGKTRKKISEHTSVKCNWAQEQETAFQKLKDAFCNPPVLGYANYQQPFELHTDTSSLGLGAVLYQNQDGHLRSISYASRGLSKSERNYPAHKLEFLALKWAVTEKFNDYLYGQDFTVYTDNNPLTYVLAKAKLDATGHRWLSALSAYNFNIVYRPGKSNTDADVMSRLLGCGSEDPGCDKDLQIFAESVQAVCNGMICGDQPWVECLSASGDVVDIMEPEDIHSMETMTPHQWRQLQAKDDVICHWLPFLRQNRKPNRKTMPVTPDTTTMFRVWDSLQLKRGVLYRIVYDRETDIQQLVLPYGMRDTVLKALHNDIGHPGRDKTLSLLKERFFWPHMSKDVDEWIKKCPSCLLWKSLTNTRVPMVSIVTTQPMELVCMDFLTLET